MSAGLFEGLGRLDFAAFQWLRTHQFAGLDVVMAGLSDVTRAGALWVGLAALIALLYPARWPAAVQVILAILIAQWLADYAAKPFVNRSRPFEMYVETRVYGYKPTTRSLPSGHAANAIAAAYTLTRLAPEGRAIFWMLAGLVAFSRVYLGVHYPTDIVAGGLLGLAVAWFVVGRTSWTHHQRPAR
jgi:undecaprenyl-diphosphatase